MPRFGSRFGLRFVSPRRSGRRVRSSLAEPLEARRLLATTVIASLGDITNPAFEKLLTGQQNTADVERYKFTLGRSATLFAALSHMNKANIFDADLSAELKIRQLDGSGNAVATVGDQTFVRLSPAMAINLPAGSYAADVVSALNLGSFDLVLHGDLAKSGETNGGYSATVGRDLGHLSVAGLDTKDFAGFFQGDTSQVDPADTYLFDVVKQGTLTVTIDAFDDGLANIFTESLDVGLFRDSNNNGVFAFTNSAEALSTASLVEGHTFTTIRSLSPGHYGVVVDGGVSNVFGFDYRLRLSYSVPDQAGSTPSTAKDLGTVGNANVSATDYLSAADTADVYKFQTLAGGPFSFTGALTGQLAGSNFQLELARDSNGNNVIDSGEVIATNPRAGNLNETVTKSFDAPGTYLVRVRRISGEGPYTITFNCPSLDRGGNTFGTATNIGTLIGKQIISDVVSANDTVDFYRFALDAAGTIQASTAALAAGADVSLTLFHDANNNGQFDAGELLQTSNNAGAAAEFINKSVAAGTYLLRVSRVAGTADYDLSFSADFAGSTLATARAITPGASNTVVDFVGAEDTTDIYKFSVNQQEAIGLFPSNMGDVCRIKLGADSNHDGVLQSTEFLVNQLVTTGSASITGNLTVFDTYFVVVQFEGTVGTTYFLTVGTGPLDKPGSSPATAKNAGSLSTGSIVGQSDRFSDDQINALDDFIDTYKVTAPSAGEMTATVTGLAGVIMFVGQDVNSDGILQAGELVGASTGQDDTERLIAVLPAAGTYFVQLLSSNVGSYNLGMSFSRQTPFGGTPKFIAAAGSTRIEAEAFDAGPDPDAYHDSDATNQGGQFRTDVGADIKATADPIGGDFRVTDTKAGEFLEYTINTVITKTYDVDVRLAGNGDGATFHLEVDGTNVTGTQIVPNTRGFDAMTDVTVHNVALAAGTHVLRLSMDAGAANGPLVGFAGAYNFMTFTVVGSPGAFQLQPRHTFVAAGQDAELALSWTVPSQGSWRQLKTTDLQLLGDDGTTIRVRWTEADNTFALFDPKTGRFGTPRELGSNAVLSNKLVKVELKESSVHAAGPTAPTVSVTFVLDFSRAARGRRFVVQAAARDDLGRHSDFELAGLLDVAP